MAALSAVDLLAIVAAVVLAAAGGEAFLKGVLGLAGWLRVPKLLVASTLAAFATSSPEFTVSTMAAAAGKPEIGLGDALGSNVVNIALILGIGLLFGSISVPHKQVKRDYVWALGVPLLTIALALDSMLSRFDGAVLLVIFAGWLGFVIRSGRANRPATDSESAPPQIRAVLLGFAGLVALLLAGRLFVSGASGIAAAFGLSAYVVGATVVALGTSLPELVTMLLSRLRGHDEVGVGTLLGSNLFNGLAIVGTAACIHPIGTTARELVPAIGFAVFSVVLAVPDSEGRISQARGVALLLLYALFAATSLAAK